MELVVKWVFIIFIISVSTSQAVYDRQQLADNGNIFKPFYEFWVLYFAEIFLADNDYALLASYVYGKTKQGRQQKSAGDQSVVEIQKRQDGEMGHNSPKYSQERGVYEYHPSQEIGKRTYPEHIEKLKKRKNQHRRKTIDLEKKETDKKQYRHGAVKRDEPHKKAQAYTRRNFAWRWIGVE